MASEARRAFDKNAEDIERLLDLHSEKGGSERGRRFGLEVLNKSAIVLITACWEAYCEDLAAEGLQHIVDHSKASNSLPDDLRKRVASELKKDAHELAVWSLSGDGWRNVLSGRLERLREERNRKLNSPKSANIDELFNAALGIARVSDSWKWARKMTAARSRIKLDRYVELRGAVAHRGKASKNVQRNQVDDYFEFVKRLASKTGGVVNHHVTEITTKPLWMKPD